MKAADTSVEAYIAMRLSGRIGKQQREIVAFLARRGSRDWTRAEMAREIGIPLQSVCGRVRELLDARILEELPRRGCRETGRSAHPLKLPAVQAALPLEMA